MSVSLETQTWQKFDKLRFKVSVYTMGGLPDGNLLSEVNEICLLCIKMSGSNRAEALTILSALEDVITQERTFSAGREFDRELTDIGKRALQIVTDARENLTDARENLATKKICIIL